MPPRAMFIASRAGGATAAPGRRPRHAGFTLIELMTAVVVLAIVAFAAAPSFSSMLAQQRVRGAALDLSSSLLLARSEAVKRNATVSVAATGTAWTGGWTVAAGAETVRSFGAYQGLSIVASGGNTLSVGNDGRLTGGALTFQLAPSTGASNASTVCVQISATGRVASSTGACT